MTCWRLILVTFGSSHWKWGLSSQDSTIVCNKTQFEPSFGCLNIGNACSLKFFNDGKIHSPCEVLTTVFGTHRLQISMSTDTGIKKSRCLPTKTVLNTRGTGRAESTQRQLYVFMALLGVSRLRVSADPQVLKAPEDRLKLLAVKLRVVPWKRKVVSVLCRLISIATEFTRKFLGQALLFLLDSQWQVKVCCG